jgi:hypothetical protein
MAPANPRFEAMPLGRLLDRAFGLYVENFPLMLGIIASAYVPLYAIKLVMQAGMGPVTASGRNLTVLVSQLALIVLWASLALPVATGAATYAISERYLGRDVTVGGALKQAWIRLWTLTIAQLSVMIRVFLGFLLFFIPGVLWSLSYALVVPVVLLEGKKALPSLRRSWELVKSHRGKVFIVLVVVNVLQWLASFGVGSLSELVFDLESVSGSLMHAALGDVISIFLTPLAVIADILLYYDFRIRKEGFDLEMLSRSLAATQSTDP